MSRFTNGAWVSRVYGDNDEGEVLAEFQYASMAHDFARSYLAGADAGAPFHMIVTDCHSGDTRIWRQRDVVGDVVSAAVDRGEPFF